MALTHEWYVYFFLPCGLNWIGAYLLKLVGSGCAGLSISDLCLIAWVCIDFCPTFVIFHLIEHS